MEDEKGIVAIDKLKKRILDGKQMVGATPAGIRSMIWVLNEIRDGRYPYAPPDPVRAAAALLGRRGGQIGGKAGTAAQKAAQAANARLGGRPLGAKDKQKRKISQGEETRESVEREKMKEIQIRTEKPISPLGCDIYHALCDNAASRMDMRDHSISMSTLSKAVGEEDEERIEAALRELNCIIIEGTNGKVSFMTTLLTTSWITDDEVYYEFNNLVRKRLSVDPEATTIIQKMREKMDEGGK